MESLDLLKFTSRVLTLQDYPEFIDKAEISGLLKQDPDLIIRYCDDQLILPRLYLHLKNAGLLDSLPPDYSSHLEEIYRLNKQRNAEILEQLDEINHILAKANIQAIYLKGTAHLLDGLYTDTATRMMGDIDLLVRDEDYLKAAEIIKNELGYKTDEKIYTDVTEAKHYPRLYRDDVSADLELHRLAVDYRYSKAFHPESIFRHKKKIQNRTNCFVPSDEHQLIHNFIHVRLNNRGHRFKTFAFLDAYDFYLLSKRTKAEEVTTRVTHKRELKTYYFLVGHFLYPGFELPFRKDKSIEKYISKLENLSHNPDKHHRYILYQKLVEVIFSRIPVYVKRFFTNKNIRKGAFERMIDGDWYKNNLYRMKHFYQDFVAE